MQLSIITSLFNRLDLTRHFLQSVEQTLAGRAYEIILIDDGSTDGTREFLGTLPAPRFRIWLNEERRGFAANNNTGARLAQAPLLAMLNNDLVLLPGWFEPMERLIRWMPRVACVGNVQREPVSGLIDHYGVFFDEHGQPLHAGRNEASLPRAFYGRWPAVTAACWLIRRQVFLEVGGFDENFRNGMEDVDFCLRARALGYHHAVANRSVVYHHISSSPGRKENELTNFQLLCQRWPAQRPPLVGMTSANIMALQQEGWRYLRKHALRPWRYNADRLRVAWEKIRRPLPETNDLSWRARADIFWHDRLRRQKRPAGSPPNIYMLVHDTVRNPSRSGIQTVVRSLAAAFGRAAAPVGLVVWDDRCQRLRPLPDNLSAGLEAEKLRPNICPGGPPPGSWVLMPELMYRGKGARLVEYLRRRKCRLAVIFHDAIPVQHPEFAPPNLPAEHAAYMRDFSSADLVLPVSESSAGAWRTFNPGNHSRVKTCTLAADISHWPRVTALKEKSTEHEVRILCVSSLEPRKNHTTLLDAFDLAVGVALGVNLKLDLVGAPYVGAHHLVEQVHCAMNRHPGRVHWHEQVEYSHLRLLYEQCDFTVYPSLAEGFGLPVVESLWCARPCICANFGVMAENARAGGCLTADVRDAHALSEAILALALDPTRRKMLGTQAIVAALKSWEEYAREILNHLGESAPA